MIKYTKEELEEKYRELWMHQELLGLAKDNDQKKFLKEKIKELYENIRFLKGNIALLKICEEKNVETD